MKRSDIIKCKTFNRNPNHHFPCKVSTFFIEWLVVEFKKDQGVDLSKDRIPLKYMADLFGPEVEQALKLLKREMQRTRDGERSELMEILIAKRWEKMFGHLSTDPTKAM